MCCECKRVQLLYIFFSRFLNYVLLLCILKFEKSNPTLPDSVKKCRTVFWLCCSSTWCYMCAHLYNDFISFCKQPQYESTPLQPDISERSTSHLEELERKVAAAENKELQLSEFIKQISNKSSEEKKKMEEKVSVFRVPNFLLTPLQQCVFCFLGSN